MNPRFLLSFAYLVHTQTHALCLLALDLGLNDFAGSIFAASEISAVCTSTHTHTFTESPLAFLNSPPTCIFFSVP